VDFAGINTLSVGPRSDAARREWPVVLRADLENFEETALEPITSYADALVRMKDTAADRLFIPADVMAQLVADGVGPGAPGRGAGGSL
jgi:hypothetical protein